MALAPNGAAIMCATLVYALGFAAGARFTIGALLLLSGVSASFVFGSATTTEAFNLQNVAAVLLVMGALTRTALGAALPVRSWQPLLLVAFALLIALSGVVDPVKGFSYLVAALLPFAVFLLARYGNVGMSSERFAVYAFRLVELSVPVSLGATVLALVIGAPLVTAMGGGFAPRFNGAAGAGTYAFFLLTPLFLASAMLAVRPTKRAALALAIVTGLLLLTVTRSALIGAALGLLAIGYYAVALPGVRRLGLVVATVVSAAIIAYSPLTTRFVGSSEVPTSVARGNLTARENLWSFVWHEYVEPSPVTGKGLGSTAALFIYRTGPAGGAGDMHNDYLKIWAQLGIAGLVLYVLGIAAVWRGALQGGRKWFRRVALTRSDLDPRVRAVWLAVPGALVGLLFVSYFDNGIANALHLGVVVFGLAGIAARLADSRKHLE